MRAGNAGHDGPVLGADAPEGARELQHLPKLRVYDGESLKDVDPKAKALQEYKDYAGTDEGHDRRVHRFAYKILSSVFNYDQTEVAANPCT